MSTPTKPQDSLTPDLIAMALNEQGFLFQQKISIEVIKEDSVPEAELHYWHRHAVELPVSIPSGEETRADIVLSDPPDTGKGWHLILECKRAHPDYKSWVFFDKDGVSFNGGHRRKYYIETARLGGTWDNNGEPPMLHMVEQVEASPKCPIFSYYLESRMERPGQNKSVAATKATEESFQQVTLAQAGIAKKLRQLKKLNFTLAPVVVTTAKLAAVNFDIGKVTLDKGTIDAEELSVSPLEWLAVNYRINDSLLHGAKLSTNIQGHLASDLEARQIRTVFVVQAEKINSFLRWFQLNISEDWGRA